MPSLPNPTPPTGRKRNQAERKSYRLRQLLSYFVFKQRGLDGAPIAILPEEELAKYLDEQYLYPPVDGTLIRGDGAAIVYVIQNGARKGLTAEAFSSRGYKFADVKVLPQGEVEQYQLGADIIQ